MENRRERFKNKSFGWAFYLTGGFIAIPAWWGDTLGLSPMQKAMLVVVAGFVPLSIQLATGYGLDRFWVARFCRAESPRHYWASLTVSILAAVFFAYGAYRFFLIICLPGNLTKPSNGASS